MTLYEITEGMKQLLFLAQTEELDPEALKDTMEGLEGAFEDKADSYAVVMNEIDGDVAKIDAEIKRLQSRKTMLETNKLRIGETLKGMMVALNKTKFKTTLHSFGVVGNGGLKPLKVTGEVPEEFKKVKTTIENDNDKIRKYLEENECEWAHLEERGTRLSIK